MSATAASVVTMAKEPRVPLHLVERVLQSPLVQVSEPKLQLLRLLGQRPATASELGRAGNVHKTASYRHLRQLEAAGLVARAASKRKGVYYSLTEEAQALLPLFVSRG